jgi:hypothetical protein
LGVVASSRILELLGL